MMIVITLLAGLVVSRPAPHVSLPGFGMEGAISCNHAWLPAYRAASEAYVNGFWEGADLITRSAVGETMGREGVLAAVRERCRRAPFELLGGVTALAYQVACNHHR